MSEEKDTREQVEEGAEEDLELKNEDADKVRGGMAVPIKGGRTRGIVDSEV